MSTHRTQRINEEVLRAVADILPTVKDPRVSGMISVLRVDVTNDLKHAKIYLSMLEKQDKKEVLRGLISSTGYIRRELGQRVQLRQLPELNFILDDSIAEGNRILDIMGQL